MSKLDTIFKKCFSDESCFKNTFVTKDINRAVSLNDSNKSYLNAIIISGKKTGSTSMYASFKKLGKNTTRLTCYDLTYAIKDDETRKYVIQFNSDEFLKYCSKNCHHDDNILVVSSIRDPIDETISEFFWNIKAYVPGEYDEIENKYIDNIQELINIFNQNIMNNLILSINHWPIYEDDISNHEANMFDKEKKYYLEKIGNIYYLILRFDNIKKWNSIIRAIPKFEEFNMSRVNIDDEKSYSELHRVFRENYTMPSNIINDIYNKCSESINFYFTSDEIDEMKIKWTIKGSSAKKNCINIYWERHPDSVQNFGDALGPYIVEKLTNLEPIYTKKTSKKEYLVTVGDIASDIPKNGTIWGSGFINCNEIPGSGKIIGVRGKLTQDIFKKKGIDSKVIGDPTLLLPLIFKPGTIKKYEVAIFPDISEMNVITSDKFSCYIIYPDRNIEDIIIELLSCKFVVSSSLYGIIVCNAYNIPVVPVKFTDRLTGDEFRFIDYYSSININPIDGIIRYNLELFDGHILNIIEQLKDYSKKFIPTVENIKTLEKLLLDSFPFDIKT